jgi:predicted GNAT family acetyltransferase
MLVKIDELENKIYALVEGQECVLNFRPVSPQVWEFYRTYVPESLRNRGIAKELVTFGLKKAQSQNKKVMPTCGYVRSFIDDNPEWSALISQ